MMFADPDSLKNRWGFRGNARIDFVSRELLTAEIQVESNNSTHRGSIPEESNFPTAFAAA